MKVLIIDDQLDVVHGMKDGIDWECLPVTDVFVATNAEMAKKIIKKDVVDILLCDIEMPGESGLELCRWARTYYPDIEFIILTSHAEFDYAKTALKLGSFDYLLQPAPYEEITSCVRRLCQSILRKQEQHRNAFEGEILRDKKMAVLENCLSDLCNGRDQDVEIDKILPLFIKGNYKCLNIFPVLLKVCQMGLSDEGWDRKCFVYELKKTLDKIFIPYFMESIVVSIDDMRFWVFLCGEQLHMNILDCISGLVKYKESEKGIQYYTTIYYKKITDVQNINTVLIEIAERECRQVAPPPALYSCDDSEWVDGHNRLYLLHTQKWAKWLETYKGIELKREITEFFNNKKNRECLDREMLRYLYFYLVKAMLTAVSNKHLRIEQLFPDDATLKIFSEGYVTFGHFMGCVNRISDFFSEESPEFEAPDNAVEQAVIYIKENLDQNLSRNDIAEFVHLNAEYFSRLFKKNTGYTVGDFILKEKMTMAKKLLGSTNLPVSLVALKVGYCNFSYFTQLYKKTYGMTPNEYRQHL